MLRDTSTAPNVQVTSAMTALAWATLNDADALDRVAAGRALAKLVLEVGKSTQETTPEVDA